MKSTTAGDGEILGESAVEIAADVLAGRRRACDVYAACMARHEASRGRLNALVQLRQAESLAEAAAIDRAPGELPGKLLAGVPVSVKECFPVCGLQTTLGIPARIGQLDTADAAIVQRLREAGGVVIGKANVPQAMYLHETENPVFGRTNHPQTVERGPGGSSGGDAALVAAGVLPLAVGTDLAGSLRQPAHACGVATIMPRSVVLGEAGSIDTLPHLRLIRPRAGFLARSVADLALACEATTGALPSRPSIRRVGWWDATGPVPASAAVRRGVAEAIGQLQSAGVEVVPVDASLFDEAAWLHLAILSANGGREIRSLLAGSKPMPAVGRLLRLAGTPRWLRPPVALAARLTGRRIEASGLLATGPRDSAGVDALLVARRSLAERFAIAGSGCDALLGPVSAVPALRHGTAAGLLLAVTPCLAANLLDLAAGAVPVTSVRPEEERGRPRAWDPVLRAAAATDRGSRGLPVGVQVVATPGGDEATVLEVMRLIEQGSLTH